MLIYLILFLVICIVVILLNTKTTVQNHQNKSDKFHINKKRKIENFENYSLDMDDVMDNYCMKENNLQNYLGPWDGMPQPICSSNPTVDNCEARDCYKLVKDKLVSHSNVYKYVSSNIEHTNQGGICKPLSNEYNCDITPELCVTTSNILGWYFDEYWKSHNCRYHYNSNGLCVLRDEDNGYEEVKIVDIKNPSKIVHGNASASTIFYSESGPNCEIIEWDKEIGILRDDTEGGGNIYKIEDLNIDPKNPYDSLEGFFKCVDGDTIAYTHMDNTGFNCGFAGDCDTCDVHKNTCYQFDQNTREYKTNNFVNTFLDKSPDNPIELKDCGNYLANSLGNSNFASTDFSQFDNNELYNRLNHGGEIIERKDVENCVRTIPVQCSTSNVHMCQEYDNDSRTFKDKQFKQIYNSTGTECEYCPLDFNNDCMGNVNDYKSNTECPPVGCPIGMGIERDGDLNPVRCVPCNSNEYYDSQFKNCETLSSCAKGSKLIENELLKSYDIDRFENSRTRQTTFLNNYESVSNLVMLEDLKCKPCGRNTYTDIENKLFECKPCGEGKVSDLGAEECTRCPNGFYRSNGMVDCVSCPEGHISVLLNDKSYCDSCTTQFKVPNEDRTKCVECPEDETFEQATMSCRKLCDEYNFWNSNESLCERIPGGKYKNVIFNDSRLSKLDVLLDCPKDTYRNDSMKGNSEDDCLKCETDKYSKVGSSKCIKCNKNAYWNGEECISCVGSNSVINDVASGCKSCENPPGWTQTNKKPNGANTECVCKDGYHIHSFNKECIGCRSNEYWEVDSNACFSCPDGQVGMNRVGFLCDDCPANTFRRGLMQECEACPLNEYSGPGSSNCTKCGTNEYWSSNNNACLSCPDGEIGTFGLGIESCDFCDKHTYRKGIEMAQCKECIIPKGEYTLGIGSTECLQCPEGHSYDINNSRCIQKKCGITGISRWDEGMQDYYCEMCHSKFPKGQIADHDSNICVKCQDNAHATENNICECDEGFLMNIENECVKCDNSNKGMYWNSNNLTCTQCLDHLYSTGTSCEVCGYLATVDPRDKSKCTCSEDIKALGFNLMSNNSCVQCDAIKGQVYDSSNLTCGECDLTSIVINGECVQCDEHSIPNNENRTECLCVEGYYKDGDECKVCDGIDRYWNNDMKICVECGNNEFVKDNICVKCGLNAKRDGNSTNCILDYVIGNNSNYYHKTRDGLSFKYCDKKSGFYWNEAEDMCQKCANDRIVNSNGECDTCPLNEEPDINDFTQCDCVPGFNRYNGNCIKPDASTCPDMNEYYVIENFENNPPNFIENFQENDDTIQCLRCPANHVANDRGDGCICDNDMGFYGEPNNCIECPLDHYWDEEKKVCFRCGKGSFLNNIGEGNYCECEDINAVPVKNFLTSNIECVCDNSNNYFGDSTEGCVECYGSDKYWDKNSNACLICGEGTRLNRSGNGCECVTSPGGLLGEDNWGDIICGCDEDNEFYGDILDGCVKCKESDNKYYSMYDQECITCGKGAVADSSYGSCECPDRNTILNETNDCVCNNRGGYYGKPDSREGCQECLGTGDKYWDELANNRRGACITCGDGTRLNDSQTECECIGLNGKRVFDKFTNTYTCACDERRGYYGDINWECTECVSDRYGDGERYWKDDSRGGECITCGDGTRLNRQGNACECIVETGGILDDSSEIQTCECNNETHFGNILDRGCFPCEGEKNVWLASYNGGRGRCIECGEGTKRPERGDTECECEDPNAILDDRYNCICNNSKGYYGDASSRSGCELCESDNFGEKYWDYKLNACVTCGEGTVYNDSRNRCECEDPDSTKPIFNDYDNIWTCECDTEKGYYGDVMNFGGCVECASTSRDKKYWDDSYSGECISCGSGSKLNEDETECVSKSEGGICNLNENPVTCECNNTTHFGNINDRYGCIECDRVDQVWIEGEGCVTCGEGSEVRNGQCECIGEGAVGSIDFRKKFNCVCNEDYDYYGNDNTDCVLCTSDNNSYWNRGQIGECITCGGLSTLNNRGTGCDCSSIQGAVYNKDLESCECDTRKKYFGDLSVVQECTQCTGRNKYWDTNKQECITCGEGTKLNRNKDGCVCISAEGSVLNEFTNPQTCECNNETHFGDISSGYCTPCNENNQVWLNGKCITCGQGTITTSDGCKCIDENSAKLIRNSQGTEFSCECDENNQFYGNDSTRCSECKVEDESYWKPGVGNQRGECITCDGVATLNRYNTGCDCATIEGAEFNNNTNKCECDESRKYFGNLEFVNECTLCNGLNEYWNGEECIICGNGTRLNREYNTCECISDGGILNSSVNPQTCECNNDEGYFGNRDNCSRCDSDTQYWNDLQGKCITCDLDSGAVFGVDDFGMTKCECNEEGLKSKIVSGKFSCECDENANYYGDGNGECTYCADGEFPQYWKPKFNNNPGECITCGPGTSLNATRNSCRCDDEGGVLIEESGYHTCECNEDRSYYGNIEDGCVYCPSRDHYWDNLSNSCIKCGVGSKLEGGECVCNDEDAIPNELIQNENGTYEYTCDCDNEIYFGNNGSCEECSSDRSSSKYWDSSMNGNRGACITCGEASIQSNPGEACECIDGANFSTRPGVNRSTGIHSRNKTHECECPHGMTISSYGDLCVCDEAKNFYEDPETNQCVECGNTRYNNEYWDGFNCITCGNGSVLNNTGDSCICEDTDKTIISDYGALVQTCVCDTSNGYYGNVSDCKLCSSDETHQRYWDSSIYNNRGGCVTCGKGSRLNATEDGCECRDQNSELKPIRGGVIECSCNEDYYFVNDNTICVPCPRNERQKWISATTTEEGYCKLCNPNEIIGVRNNCKCDNDNYYYGESGNCQLCSPDNNQYWDKTKNQCITCDTTIEKLVYENNRYFCKCKNEDNFYGKGTTHNAASTCEVCGEKDPVTNKAYSVYKTDANSGYCLECDPEYEILNGSNNCECNAELNYFGVPTGKLSWIGDEFQPHDCKYCDKETGYWKVDYRNRTEYCVQCGEGTRLNAARNECVCIDAPATERTEEVQFDGSRLQTCQCNNTTHFLDNDTCVECSGSKEFWKNGVCYKCGDNARKSTTIDECQCSGENKIRYLEEDNVTWNCMCDEDEGFYAKGNGCVECTPNNLYDKHWNYKLKKCIRCDKTSGSFNNYDQDENVPGSGCSCNPDKKIKLQTNGIYSCECDEDNDFYGGNNVDECTYCPTQTKINNKIFSQYNIRNECVTCDSDKEFVNSRGECECDTDLDYYGQAGSCVYCGDNSYWDRNQETCFTCAGSANLVNSGSLSKCDCSSSPGMVPKLDSSTNTYTCDYCPKGSYKLNTSCQSCRPNKTTPDSLIGATHPDQCTKSVNGCLQPNYIKPDDESCQTCPVGSRTYNDNSTGKESCQCDQGSYYDSVSDRCQPCPTGKFSEIGALSVDECYYCDEGLQLNKSTRICEPCPIGKYKGNTADTGEVHCTSCPSGMTTLSTNSTSVEECICSANKYRKPTLSGGYSCTPCPSGTISPAGSISVDECTNICTGIGEYYNMSTQQCDYCQAGYQVSETTGRCAKCLADTYREEGSFNNGLCMECPIGTSTNYRNGRTSASHCIPDNCLANQYKTPSGNCQSCPSNKISPAGSTSVSDCIPSSCPLPGQYVNGGICSFCPAGQEPVQGQCGGCQAGFYKPYENTNNGLCLACPGAQQSNPNKTGCIDRCTSSLEYWNGASCQPCDPGTVPSDDKLSCDACPANQYRSENDARCISCPFGSTSPEGSTSILSCACPASSDGNTKIINPQSKSCVYCPPGEEPLNNEECTACSVNTYRSSSSSGGGRCIECPESKPVSTEGATGVHMCGVNECDPGEYLKNNSCFTCPSNKPVSSGYEDESSCVACDPGFEPSADKSYCAPCEGDTFSSRGKRCLPCTTPNVTLDNITCAKPILETCENENDYIINNGTKCVPCPSGRQPNLSDRTQCEDCPIGTAGQSGACDECEPGKYSPGGKILRCERCPDGKYTPVYGTSECIDCLEGQVSNSDRTDCDTCPDGKTPNPRKTSCMSCPSGTAGTGGLCYPCTDPEVPNRDRTACYNPIPSSCDFPNQYVSGTRCIACNSGTRPSSDWMSCDECNEGYAGSGGTCDACPAGTYTNTRGNRTCTPCSAGKVAPGQGSQSCQPCAVYQITNQEKTECINLDEGHVKNSDKMSSRACSSGYGPNIDYDACPPCPAGYAGIDGICRLCEGNTTPNLSRTECVSKICELDTHYFDDSFKACRACPSGEEPKADDTGCDKCLPGTAGVNGSCVPCGPGYYQNLSGQMQCRECPAGEYSNGVANTECLRCLNDGFDNTYARGTRNTECSVCDDGYEPNSSATDCRECQGNTVGVNGRCDQTCEVDEVRNPTFTSCISSQCNSGEYFNTQTQLCVPCGSGQEPFGESCRNCPAGTYGLNGVCYTCDDIGKYQDEEGQTGCKTALAGYKVTNSRRDTRQCLDGQKVHPEYDDQCTSCDDNWVGTGGLCDRECTLANNEYPNPDKKRCSSTDCTNDTHYFEIDDLGSATITGNCTVCPDGEKPAPNDNTRCEPCPAGYAGTGGVCNQCGGGEYAEGTGNTTCSPCNSDVPRSPAGSSSSNDCNGCPAGKKVKSDRTGCEACPTGQGNGGNGTNLTCTPCSPGSYSQGYDESGNKTSDITLIKSRKCVSCPDGKVSRSSGLSGCIPCILPLVPNSARTECIQTACPPEDNTYFDSTRESCELCALGEKPNERTNGCQNCPAGTYGSSRSVCTECPDGEYQDEEGRTACKTLEDGYKFIEIGGYKINQEICPHGTMPNANKDSCIPCSRKSGGNFVGENGKCDEECRANENKVPHNDGTRCISSVCTGNQWFNNSLPNPTCVPAGNGHEPDGFSQKPCAVGYAGMGGVCNPCSGPGEYVQGTGNTSCSTCGGGQKVVLTGTVGTSCTPCGSDEAGTGGTCSACGPGKEPNSDNTACISTYWTYDTAELPISSGNKVGFQINESVIPDHPGSLDEDIRKMRSFNTIYGDSLRYQYRVSGISNKYIVFKDHLHKLIITGGPYTFTLYNRNGSTSFSSSDLGMELYTGAHFTGTRVTTNPHTAGNIRSLRITGPQKMGAYVSITHILKSQIIEIGKIFEASDLDFSGQSDITCVPGFKENTNTRNRLTFYEGGQLFGHSVLHPLIGYGGGTYIIELNSNQIIDRLPGSINVNEQACSPSQYLEGAVCLDCPAGSSSNEGSRGRLSCKCVTINDQRDLLNGKTNRLKGNYYKGQTLYDTDSQACIWCPAGQEPNDNGHACKPCSDTTYRKQDNYNNGYCKNCPSGTHERTATSCTYIDPCDPPGSCYPQGTEELTALENAVVRTKFIIGYQGNPVRFIYQQGNVIKRDDTNKYLAFRLEDDGLEGTGKLVKAIGGGHGGGITNKYLSGDGLEGTGNVTLTTSDRNAAKVVIRKLLNADGITWNYVLINIRNKSLFRHSGGEFEWHPWSEENVVFNSHRMVLFDGRTNNTGGPTITKGNRLRLSDVGCPANHYLDADGSCKQCPTGSTSPFNNKMEREVCDCSTDGQAIVNTDSTACTWCPANEEPNDIGHGCRPCDIENREYRNEGGNQGDGKCLKCPIETHIYDKATKSCTARAPCGDEGAGKSVHGICPENQECKRTLPGLNYWGCRTIPGTCLDSHYTFNINPDCVFQHGTPHQRIGTKKASAPAVCPETRTGVCPPELGYYKPLIHPAENEFRIAMVNMSRPYDVKCMTKKTSSKSNRIGWENCDRTCGQKFKLESATHDGKSYYRFKYVPIHGCTNDYSSSDDKYLDMEGSKGDNYSGKVDLQNKDDGNKHRLFQTTPTDVILNQDHETHRYKLQNRDGKYLQYKDNKLGGSSSVVGSDVLFLPYTKGTATPCINQNPCTPSGCCPGTSCLTSARGNRRCR